MAYALPELYDHLYAYKDYAGESARVTSIVRARNPAARTLLDVACGTGRHLEHLREAFDVEGVDLDEGLLALARARLPSTRLEVGDMRTLDLGRRFDAVTCLFSAVGHLADTSELAAAIAAMAAHLNPNGVLVVEPWIEPDQWISGKPALLTVDEPDLKIARVTLTGRRGNTSILDFHYLVATPDGIETHAERMELGLFTADDMGRSFEQAGLCVEHDPEGLIGRGLFVGRAA
jgi:SAM-dependent methyltransferase